MDFEMQSLFYVTSPVIFSSRGQQPYSYTPGCISMNFLGTIFVFVSFYIS